MEYLSKASSFKSPAKNSLIFGKMSHKVLPLSLPFEIEPVKSDRVHHIFARGHLDLTPTGIHLVYHRYTALLEMEQHETFNPDFAEIKNSRLKMSLFSAVLEIHFSQTAGLENLFGLSDGCIQLKIHRKYRDQACAVADRLQRELSKIMS